MFQNSLPATTGLAWAGVSRRSATSAIPRSPPGAAKAGAIGVTFMVPGSGAKSSSGRYVVVVFRVSVVYDPAGAIILELKNFIINLIIINPIF